MNRAERRRQEKEDDKRLKSGIDPESSDPEPIAAMARQMHALLETAKRDKNIDPPARFLHAKADATLQSVPVRVDCKKGCSHCCHAWVSATIPEVLFLAKLIRKRAAATLSDNVHRAHAATRDYDFAAREKHPQACPMLDQDLCSVYESRPVACRFAASADALKCFQALRQLSGGTIPTPMRHLKGRGVYNTAVVIALKHSGLPHHFYELNSALARALERADAESAWLSGEDVFFDVKRDPSDIWAGQTSRQLYKHAFG